MIRRNVLQGERDRRVVKWALIASAFALSLGCYAEIVLSGEMTEATKTTAAQQVPAVPAATEVPARIAG